MRDICRTIIIIFSFLTIKGYSQYVPAAVEDSLLVLIDKYKTDTVAVDTIYYENYRYTFKVKLQDSIYFGKIIDKKWLYFRPKTAIGVTTFCTTYSTFFLRPKFDKYLHFGAGAVIGGGTNILMYKLTKKKWLSFGTGVALGSAVGILKERYDLKHGGVCSNADAWYTVGGSIYGSLTIRFILK